LEHASKYQLLKKGQFFEFFVVVVDANVAVAAVTAVTVTVV